MRHLARVLLFNTFGGSKTNTQVVHKNCLYTCLIVCSFLSISAKEKHEIRYVHNIDEFKTHTRNHIQNVTKLGLYLYYQHKNSYFKDVPEEVLREKLLYHDFEKTANLETLKFLGYQHEKTFHERLYELYGQSISRSNFKAISLVRELNNFAQKFEHQVFEKHGLMDANGGLNSVVQKIKAIEQIADLVEREMNPVSPEEFGVNRMRKASAFLRNERDLQMARELARAYHQVVQPNPLIYIVKSNTLTQALPQGSCSRLFH